MSAIVLVHGIAQEHYSADYLEKDWVPALAGGIRNAGFPEVADRIVSRGCAAVPDGIEAHMAFYGHLFLQPGSQGGAEEEMSPDQEALAEQLSFEWLERAESRSDNAKDRQAAAIELSYLRPDPAHEEQGVRSQVRVIYNSLARLPWIARVGSGIAQRFAVRTLSQVTKYLTDDAIRAKIQGIVQGLIGDDTRVIVAHSLGSIVAFEVAHELDRPLPLLVTLGSPLGINTIVLPKVRPQPPSFPPQVRRWVNVADRNDLVAAEPNLMSLFAASMPKDAIFEGAYTVDNGADPHKSHFYLGKEHIGRPIGQVFSVP
jgi:hypothetical protein